MSPALDGGRGIAVVAIMGYHGGIFLTGGGFYSLDTFFALSGFLITTLIVEEWQQSGRIRLAEVLGSPQRADCCRHCCCCCSSSWATSRSFLLQACTPGFAATPSASLFYVANWHFIVEGSNYFAQTGPTSPLLHTWSLAVEEQFYLVWPIVVVLILRTRFALRLLFLVERGRRIGIRCGHGAAVFACS